MLDSCVRHLTFGAAIWYGTCGNDRNQGRSKRCRNAQPSGGVHQGVAQGSFCGRERCKWHFQRLRSVLRLMEVPQFLSPKAPSRALSPTRTATAGGANPERPWSPRTAASQNQSVKSRNTQKTQRTQYPPLPDSVADDAQRTTRAYSIAPSESASQVGSRRLRQQQILEQQQREQELEREREPSHKPSKSVKSVTEVNGQAGTYAKSQSAGECAQLGLLNWVQRSLPACSSVPGSDVTPKPSDECSTRAECCTHGGRALSSATYVSRSFQAPNPRSRFDAYSFPCAFSRPSQR